MEQKDFIPKFIEAMNHRLQQEEKWLSDEAAKLLSQLDTWDKRMETKKETAQERRKRLDHERYMRVRDERLIKQREYYETHREQVKLKVKECKKNRWRREYDRLFTNTVTL